MKKFFAVLAVMIFFAATASAQPVKIARLPIIFQSTVPDSDTRAELETKIERAVHIPLNGTLQVAEYLPPNDSAQIFNDVWQEISSQNKKAKLADAIRPFAQKIDADIIVCPVLKEYSQYTSFAFALDETILVSRARVELIVYDRRTDDLFDEKSSLFYNDTYSPHGTASFLAKNCFDKVILRTGLQKKIRDIK